MVCLYCGSETKVTNSRHQKRINHVWRRRQCLGCGAIFTTSEAPDMLKSVVVTQDKRVEPFSRDRLFLGVYDSLKHRKTAQSDATALTDTIIGQLSARIVSGSIQRNAIVEVTGTILKRFDKSAATHYAAFHPTDNR